MRQTEPQTGRQRKRERERDRSPCAQSPSLKLLLCRCVPLASSLHRISHTRATRERERERREGVRNDAGTRTDTRRWTTHTDSDSGALRRSLRATKPVVPQRYLQPRPVHFPSLSRAARIPSVFVRSVRLRFFFVARRPYRPLVHRRDDLYSVLRHRLHKEV